MNMLTTGWSKEDEARRAKLELLFEAFERDDIELGVELLIERLDAMDPDPDREEEQDYCIAGDDGCGMVRGVWGSEHDGRDRIVPAYGTDQSNIDRAATARRIAQAECHRIEIYR